MRKLSAFQIGRGAGAMQPQDDVHIAGVLQEFGDIHADTGDDEYTVSTQIPGATFNDVSVLTAAIQTRVVRPIKSVCRVKAVTFVNNQSD